MTIQKIIYPSVEVCSDWEMYFRGVDAYEMREGDEREKPISIPKGQRLGLDTYFNSFSVGKWKKYTKLTNLSLELEIQGEVEILPKRGIGHKAKPTYHVLDTLTEEQINGVLSVTIEDAKATVTKTEKGYRVDFEELYDEGILFVEIKAISDAVFCGGAYVTSIEEAQCNPVQIVLGICTFKREEFVKKNVGLVMSDIINNPNSPLYENLEVYISDNGQTLATDTFSQEKIHLFPNKNAGGAGGFTRTMIESLFHRKNSPFTHIILMDDDINLDCAVLERTYHFLRMVKDAYKDSMVGGEMFELKKRWRQFEAGATCKGTIVTFYNKAWDMRKTAAVACNEMENPMNYSGWWYSCIPVSIIKEDNLPIPLFIHYDDIEYGIRNEKNGTILLNGICVWHPQGANKAPISMNYYDVRNTLIAMSAFEHCAGKWEIIRHIFNRIVGDVIRYRYEAAECCFMGIEDFYKGPEYFMQLDPIAHHQKMMAMNYKLIPTDGFDMSQEQNLDLYDHRDRQKLFLKAVRDWLVPAKKGTIRIVGKKDIGLPFRAEKMFFYDEDKDLGYVVERDYKMAWKNVGRFMRTFFMVLFGHNKMMKRWKNAKKDFTSLTYWEKYLDL